MTRQRRNRGVALFAGACCVLVAAAAVQSGLWAGSGGGMRSGTKRYERRFTAMGTDGRLLVLAPTSSSAHKAMDAALGQIQMVERRMSPYRADSDVSRLNRGGHPGPVKLSKPTREVLRRAAEVSRMTDGAFDVTCAPLTELWRRAESTGRMPGAESVRQALAAVGWQKLRLTDGGAALARPGMKVDLGGIAKGYALDLAAEALREAGLEAGLVDIGGDLRLLGRPADGRRWLVQVRPPRGEEPLMLRLGGCAVATSGDYARGFRVGSRWFSHIVHPRTGRPAGAAASVTVVAPEGAAADALATALSVMSPEEGIELANSLSGVECMIIKARAAGGPRRRMSGGFGRYLES